jgi:hypothetical protein
MLARADSIKSPFCDKDKGVEERHSFGMGEGGSRKRLLKVTDIGLCVVSLIPLY